MAKINSVHLVTLLLHNSIVGKKLTLSLGISHLVGNLKQLD